MIKYLLECFERRDLLLQLVITKLKADNKDTMLGYLWWLLEPLIMLLIYWFFMVVILKRGEPLFIPFLLCALIPHRAFVRSYVGSTVTISSSLGIISQVNFPRIFLPIAHVLMNHIKLLFGFLIIVVFLLLYDITINWKHILIIIPLSIQIILLTGLSFINSVIGVYFRDMANINQLMMRTLLFLSPIFYSINRVPEEYRHFYILNPLAPLYNTYRAILMQQDQISVELVLIVFSQALIVLLVGILVFLNQDKKILKYL